MITVNGKALEFDGTVAALLEREGFDPARVVVELNREILPKGEYGWRILAIGDVVEILEFVGGG